MNVHVHECEIPVSLLDADMRPPNYGRRIRKRCNIKSHENLARCAFKDCGTTWRQLPEITCATSGLEM